MSCRFILFVALSICAATAAEASVTIPLTVNLSEAVAVTGTPRVAVDVGGQTRYATYSAGTGTSALTFTLTPQSGDVDLDGIAVSSPIDLNGGTIKDLAGNNLAALTFTPPNTSGIKVNYPSLGMDFTYDADGRYTLNGTAYNDLPSFLTAAGGTFTRASIGTYYDSTGVLQTAASGAPRFDWDPVTHTPKGILIEETRTNLLNYTVQIDNGNWVKNNLTVTANTALAPDGTLTAETILANAVSTVNVRLRRDVAVSAPFSFSVYLKPDTHGIVSLQSVNPSVAQNWIGAVFDLSTGTVTQTGAGSQSILSSAIIEPVGSGWFRCSLAGSMTTYGTPAHQILFFNNSSGNASSTFGFAPSVTFVGTESLYIWGAQLEVGTEPSSYIPTTTAAVTRAADFLSLPVGAWHNALEGSVYAKTSSFNTEPTKVTAFASFDDNTVNNRLQFRRGSAATANFRIVEGGSSIVDGNSTALWTDTSFHKYAAGYKSANNKVYFDGTSAVSFLVTSAMPTVTQLQIGSGPGSSALNGYLKSLKYYPTRVSDAQLQALSQ